MNTKKTSKQFQEQITEALTKPQEFAANANKKNRDFFQEIQQIFLGFPQEVLNQQKETQEKLSLLAKQIQEITSTQPVDFIKLQQTLFQFHAENLSNQTKVAQEQFKKAQELFNIYNK